MICLTHEERRELIARYVSPPPTPSAPRIEPDPRRSRGWKEEAIVAWLLAWPRLNNREVAEAAGSPRSIYYVGQLRRRLGIPTAFSTRNDERREKMTRLAKRGWTYAEIGEAMGISRITVAGVISRARRAA